MTQEKMLMQQLEELALTEPVVNHVLKLTHMTETARLAYLCVLLANQKASLVKDLIWFQETHGMPHTITLEGTPEQLMALAPVCSKKHKVLLKVVQFNHARGVSILEREFFFS
jgi:hypothetical protein